MDNLTEAKASLTPQLTILNAFAFRHKNQHSHSHWFSTFNILRRRLRNLLALIASSRPKHEKILLHARHIHSLTPKTYVYVPIPVFTLAKTNTPQHIFTTRR